MFQCPICERNTSIPLGGASVLPQNLHLGFEVEVAGYTSKMVNNSEVCCDECVDGHNGLAVVFCCMCCQFLCKLCRDHHSSSRRFSKHKIVLLDQEGARQLHTIMKPRDHYCSQPNHGNNDLNFYSTHKTHTVKEISTVAKTHQMEITGALEDAKESHSTAIVTYWSTQLGYCTSAVLLQLISAIRKDTTFAHATFFCHLTTTTLLAISYVTKMLKIGTVVMLVHDICDMLVEVAYLLDYITYSGLSQAMFIVFAITFFVTRLLIYPFWILRSVLFVLPESVTPSPALNLTLVLLVVIQMVHVYRFQHIAVMAWRSLKGRTAKQITELSSDSDSAKKNE
eukprot:Em0004g360a